MKSKREIIFLIAVAVVAVVFLIDRLAPSMKANSVQAEQRVAGAKAFVDEQKELLSSVTLKPHELLTFNMLLNDLSSNPFAREWAGMISDEMRMNSLSAIEPVLSYNGYIRQGDRFVALVNDEDYEVGNKIDHVPLFIHSISADRIDVENPNTVSQTKLSVKILPLESDDD